MHLFLWRILEWVIFFNALFIRWWLIVILNYLFFRWRFEYFSLAIFWSCRLDHLIDVIKIKALFILNLESCPILSVIKHPVTWVRLIIIKFIFFNPTHLPYQTVLIKVIQQVLVLLYIWHYLPNILMECIFD